MAFHVGFLLKWDAVLSTLILNLPLLGWQNHQAGSSLLPTHHDIIRQDKDHMDVDLNNWMPPTLCEMGKMQAIIFFSLAYLFYLQKIDSEL